MDRTTDKTPLLYQPPESWKQLFPDPPLQLIPLRKQIEFAAFFPLVTSFWRVALTRRVHVAGSFAECSSCRIRTQTERQCLKSLL
jgi:hypothetical protein